ncbi:MAG: hypothetical protein D6798_07565 [Deltaproteobacteria bacterium]|nr:MAG: hypothetical protein D6798_07565 [Deltaproteobacteria bacterium]
MAEPDSSNPGDGVDFARLSQDLYAQWESAVTAWWDTVLDSPDVLRASGDALGRLARARKQYEQAVDDNLTRLHLPTRSDLVRLTRIATLLEHRLVRFEDQLLEMQDKLAALEREALQARVDAAEARLEHREEMAALQARLDALQERIDALEQSATRPARRRRRKADDSDTDTRDGDQR